MNNKVNIAQLSRESGISTYKLRKFKAYITGLSMLEYSGLLQSAIKEPDLEISKVVKALGGI